MPSEIGDQPQKHVEFSFWVDQEFLGKRLPDLDLKGLSITVGFAAV